MATKPGSVMLQPDCETSIWSKYLTDAGWCTMTMHSIEASDTPSISNNMHSREMPNTYRNPPQYTSYTPSISSNTHSREMPNTYRNPPQYTNGQAMQFTGRNMKGVVGNNVNGGVNVALDNKLPPIITWQQSCGDYYRVSNRMTHQNLHILNNEENPTWKNKLDEIILNENPISFELLNGVEVGNCQKVKSVEPSETPHRSDLKNLDDLDMSLFSKMVSSSNTVQDLMVPFSQVINDTLPLTLFKDESDMNMDIDPDIGDNIISFMTNNDIEVTQPSSGLPAICSLQPAATSSLQPAATSSLQPAATSSLQPGGQSNCKKSKDISEEVNEKRKISTKKSHEKKKIKEKMLREEAKKLEERNEKLKTILSKLLLAYENVIAVVNKTH